MNHQRDKTKGTGGSGGSRGNKRRWNRGRSENHKQKQKAGQRDPPICLFSECQKAERRHWLSDCKFSSEAQKIEARKKNREERERKHGKKLNICAGNNVVKEHSTLFSASFCQGRIETLVLADGGGDDNILPSSLLQQIAKINGAVRVEALPHTECFGQVFKDAPELTSKRKMDLDVDLKIRHGSKLLLRNVVVKISDQDTEFVILGRPVLEALGINACDILEEVCDKFSGVVNVDSLIGKDRKDRHESDTNNGRQKTLASVLARDQMDVFHSQGDQGNDHLEDENVYIDIGDDPDSDLDETLNNLVMEAQGNGLSEAGLERLRELLQKYRKIFRLRLGASEPAQVAPMKIQLKEGLNPVRVKARRYSADERARLEKYVEKLVEMNFIVPNPDAAWQAAPFLVPKKNSNAKYRLAIDLRHVNAATIKQAWPMPQFDSEVHDFANSKCFGTIDFCSGNWQLPVDKGSWDACGIVTPKGTYSSTRVLPGLTNATTYFQSSVAPLFKEMRKITEAWLDDFNIHGKDEGEVLELLEKFLSICKERNLFISAKKSHLFTKDVIWCGRKVSAEGYTIKPSRMDWLRELAMPETTGELCQFVHCSRWMEISIPAFQERVLPLTEVLELAFEQTGKRKKKSIQNIPLSTLRWGDEGRKAFLSLHTSILHATKLGYPKEDKVLCLYTDASDKYWSGVVTQISEEQLQFPLEEQQHEPLGFIGKAFSSTEERWTTCEKEGFAILKSFVKLAR